jgi:hypothetical protein
VEGTLAAEGAFTLRLTTTPEAPALAEMLT